MTKNRASKKARREYAEKYGVSYSEAEEVVGKMEYILEEMISPEAMKETNAIIESLDKRDFEAAVFIELREIVKERRFDVPSEYIYCDGTTICLEAYTSGEKILFRIVTKPNEVYQEITSDKASDEDAVKQNVVTFSDAKDATGYINQIAPILRDYEAVKYGDVYTLIHRVS